VPRYAKGQSDQGAQAGEDEPALDELDETIAQDLDAALDIGEAWVG
jgi:hypothetical protein